MNSVFLDKTPVSYGPNKSVCMETVLVSLSVDKVEELS